MITPYFRTALIAQKLDEGGSEGRSNWALHAPLIFVSSEFGVIRVPVGFVTDFASVPRTPLTYWIAGGVGDASAVIHDYLYRGMRSDIDRRQAAMVFREALKAEGVSTWRRWLMYEAVRLWSK